MSASLATASNLGNRERVANIMSEVRANMRRTLHGRTTTDRCCFLVIELGGRWPSWMAPPRSSRVLVQNGEETSNAFASRVVRAIAAVRREDQSLETVVIAAGWVKDHEQLLVARSRITQAVAKAMDGGPGSLLLSAHDLLPEEARHELLSTAGALAVQLAGSSIDIRVRFDTAAAVVRAAGRAPERPEAVSLAGSPRTQTARECGLATA